MNKKQRKDKGFCKYKKRLSLWLCHVDNYTARDGSKIVQPKLTDLLKDNAQYKLKNHATLCSCYMCSGHKKYNRAKQKNYFKK